MVMQRPAKPCTPVRFRPQPPNRDAQVAKQVDARDLKSLGGNTMPVRFRPWAPIKNQSVTNPPIISQIIQITITIINKTQYTIKFTHKCRATMSTRSEKLALSCGVITNWVTLKTFCSRKPYQYHPPLRRNQFRIWHCSLFDSRPAILIVA